MRSSENLPHILEVKFFNEVDLVLKYDSVASTYRVRMYFDPNNKVHAELAAVTHIHECSLFFVHEKPGLFKNENGKFTTTTDQLLLTGFCLSQLFHDSAEPLYMDIGGYSKAGLLQDCDIPTKAFPLQSDGMTYRQIVTKILSYFGNPKKGGIKFEVKSTRADSAITTTDPTGKSEVDDVISKSTAPESKNVLSYLKELAIQKNLTLSHDIFGNLIVNVPYTGNDYLFTIGTGRATDIKYLEMVANYNGQAMHSQIEGVLQPDRDGGNMGYAIVYNPLCPVVFRPKVISITSGDDNTIQKAVRSELGNELKNIPLKIVLESPVVNGKFIMPNNTILVKNRSCYLYKDSKWFIEEVNFQVNEKGTKCTLTCVLPGVYGGEIVNPFIDPHSNLPRV